jgi:2-polyprenyl-6-methoxyphenol hydroxylase-like FAD-dependent oxidoreductase
MDSADVVIVGAGVAGAASACAFAASGLSVAIVERRNLARDPNRGDALDPRVVTQLEHWDAMEGIRARGAVSMRTLLFASRRGRTLGSLHLPQPITLLNHAEIEAALLQRAVEHGAKLHRASAQVRLQDDETTLELGRDYLQAKLFIAADGGSSSIRKSLAIDCDRHDYSEAVVVLHSPHPRWLKPDAGWLMLHPDGGVLIVPTSPAGTCRVAVATRPGETREWLLADPADMGKRLAARCDLLSELSIDFRTQAHLYRLVRQHAKRYFSGSIALVGDAAHITHPSGGQGMSLAIRDAATLASATVPLLKGCNCTERDLQSALTEYELRRRPSVTKALNRTHRAARLARADPVSHVVATLAASIFLNVPGLPVWVTRRTVARWTGPSPATRSSRNEL